MEGESEVEGTVEGSLGHGTVVYIVGLTRSWRVGKGGSVPRNLSHHMDRQARIGDTMLVKTREMTGRTQTLPWRLGEKGQRRQKTKYIGSVGLLEAT